MNDSKRIKIYNDVDQTCYEISYYKRGKIVSQDIIDRIVGDVIGISLGNKTRSKNLIFENLQFEANNDHSVMRFYIENKKCTGYLHTVCTHCITIS